MFSLLTCKIQKFIMPVLAIAVIATGYSSESFARPNKKYASIVMDADTGMILHQSRANTSLHPASLTKMMTLLLVFEELEAGKLRLHDRVYISKRAAGMVPSKLDLPVGSSIRIKDAIKALVTKSANDVAVALAEKVAGSEWRFAQRMTAKARQIGMSRTNFRNASGLHHSRQVSTARDMAVLSRYLIKRYPKYYRYFSLKKFKYAGKTYNNHNRLLKTYAGMDGLKTGYIAASGFNLAASAVRGERRLIGVVFGGRSSRTRNAHMEKLLDRGFRKLKQMRLANVKPAQPPVPKQKPMTKDMLVASQYQTIQPDQFEDTLDRILGQGDFDPEASKRFETGLVAMAAHTGRPQEIKRLGRYGDTKGTQEHGNKRALSDAQSQVFDHAWSVQVGAFISPLASDIAIRKAVLSLPRELRKLAKAEISPMQTRRGTLYRARVIGFNQDTAQQACNFLTQCLIVAPKKQ